MTRLTVLSAIGAVCALVALPAIAQLPVPQPQTTAPVPSAQQAAPAQTSSPAVPSVQDFDKVPEPGTKGDYVDDDGVVREAYGNVKLTPEAEAETQRQQEIERRTEVQMGGFNWMPWSKAGSKVWGFVYKRNPAFRTDVENGLGKYLDVAIYDIDHDKNPEIIVWQWVDCVTDGCSYTIYFGNELKSPDEYVARTLRPYENGIMVDDGYYGY